MARYFQVRDSFEFLQEDLNNLPKFLLELRKNMSRNKWEEAIRKARDADNILKGEMATFVDTMTTYRIPQLERQRHHYDEDDYIENDELPPLEGSPGPPPLERMPSGPPPLERAFPLGYRPFAVYMDRHIPVIEEIDDDIEEDYETYYPGDETRELPVLLETGRDCDLCFSEESTYKTATCAERCASHYCKECWEKIIKGFNPKCPICRITL